MPPARGAGGGGAGPGGGGGGGGAYGEVAVCRGSIVSQRIEQLSASWAHGHRGDTCHVQDKFAGQS